MTDNVQKKLNEKVKKNQAKDVPEIKAKTPGFFKRNLRNFRVTIPVLAVLASAAVGSYWYTHSEGKETGVQETKEVYEPKLATADSEKTAALEKARVDSARADSAELDKLAALEKARVDSMEAVRQDSIARAALAHAQKTERQAQLKDREAVQSLAATYASNYPGFNLLIDYEIDGQRSFHSQSLPWKASIYNPSFLSYATNPAKNIEEFLKIKELGEKGYLPQNSIDAFFNRKFNTYIGDVPGEEVRDKYGYNARDGIIYGIKMKDGKPIGLDGLARVEVKSTVPSRAEIRQRVGKINIPQGWRDFTRAQKHEGGKK